MKTILAQASLLLVVPLLAVACESMDRPRVSTETDRPIDGLNRNVTAKQGGAIHDPTSLSPPPVRRDYATDR